MNKENSVLIDKSLQVFIIIAQTLAGWKSLNSEAGKDILIKHYAWGAALKDAGKLILAGPTDNELISGGKIDPNGHTTGLIMLCAKSRAEAESWAFKDPFHTQGFRRNVVYSMKISMADNALLEPLDKLIN